MGSSLTKNNRCHYLYTKGVSAAGYRLHPVGYRPACRKNCRTLKANNVLLSVGPVGAAPAVQITHHLVAAYKEYHQKGFEILSVSLDTRPCEKAGINAINHDDLTGMTHVADLDHEPTA